MNNRTGMKNRTGLYQFSFRKNGWNMFLALSILLFAVSLTFRITSENAEKAAENFGAHIEKRLKVLEEYADEALASDHSQWMSLKGFPQDMVIYRYVYDTLQSWSNQFPINNDDIGTRMVVKRLANVRSGISSPLSGISEERSYTNLGSKWYIMRSRSDGLSCKVIYGLEIQNTLLADRQKSDSGMNPKLKLPKKYVAMSLNHTGGVPVLIDGQPLLKIISETTKDIPIQTNAILRWIALLSLVISVMLYFKKHTSIRMFSVTVLTLMAVSAVAYAWALQSRNVAKLFSPDIYADGAVLFSFGALLIANTMITLYLMCVYICRKEFIKKAFRHDRLRHKIMYVAGICLTFIAAGIYVHTMFVSLIMNSNIALELYRWLNLSIYTVLVYVSYIGIMFCMLLMLQMLKPAVRELTGLRYSVFSKKWLLCFSAICALYLTVMSGVLGFRKEQDRIIVLTNRLALDRDLGLEIQLRSLEDAIATDPMVASLSELDRSDITILNRLNENYLYRVSQDYSVTATLCRDNAGHHFHTGDDEAPCIDYFGRKFMSGKQIAPGSRFRFISDELGNSTYLGSFVYYSAATGVVHMFLEIEEKSHTGENGYMNILGRTSKPGQVQLPQYYSYAKFLSGKLVSHRGNYPYPAVLNPDVTEEIDSGAQYFFSKQYIHFVNRISDEEVIITSRTRRGWAMYLINYSYLMLFTYGALYLLSKKRIRKKNAAFRNYYRTRINFVLTFSLCITLIVMTAASVTFVYKRNTNNMNNMMSDKINTMQRLMEARTKFANSWHDLNSQEIVAAMENIGHTMKSDLTLYTPGGKVFRSTSPEVFEKMLFGTRMNQEAYYSIKFKNQRFCICKEQIAGFSYYSLYAPLFNENGTIVAILNTPYYDQNYMFRHDAFFFSAVIINIFILLLVATVLLSTTIINAIFKPIIEMGEKMASTDIHSLELIKYDRDDEISTLVRAYNRMVTDLSESTRKLAQAERDKAWSEMARQVAHEIKNPLTPIKLEIQRLIRLKQKNDPNWDQKFDKVSAVVLEHIDILTETANEFSTFAKLYSEEPVRLDIDAILRDQLAIFDNKDNIGISYLGMPDAFVTAPKPQLIRVFVNLLTNAIQAIEIQQKEDEENGRPFKKGEILICLRNSTVDGYYDIVFEDNGPGVSEENRSRLFTPNFTTKSGGTGLGLAISRNIVEKCNGEISYRKSYNLYGACFTVRLPKEKGNQ